MQGLKKIMGDRHFLIPRNQRGYSWGADELEALRRDLELAATHSKNHYCGVLITRTDQNVAPVRAANYELSNLHILEDGQQRLTTFLLLLLSIRKRLESFRDPQHAVQLAEIDNLLYYYDHTHKALRLAHEQEPLQHALDHVFMGGPRPTQLTGPVKALLGAVKWCKDELTDALDADGCLEWKNRIANQALIALVDLRLQNLDPYLTFDAINSRGLPLSQFDKVKNFALLLVQRRSLSATPEYSWYAALEALEANGVTDRNDEEKFVSEMHSVFFGKRIQREMVHRDFVGRYSPLISASHHASELELVEYIATWQPYAAAYSLVVAADDTRSRSLHLTPGARKWLMRLDNLGMPSVTRPILVTALMRFPPSEFEAIAAACEMYTFRVHAVKGFRVDKGSPEILGLARKILKGEVAAVDVVKRICTWLQDLAPLDTVIADLANGLAKYPYDRRVRGWEHSYYFLYEYELSVSPLGVSPIDWSAARTDRVNTIEHVLPQNHRDGGWWESQWPNGHEAEAAKHRLGNLVLTANNSSLGRKAFPEKLHDPSGGYSFTHAQATNGEKALAAIAPHGAWGLEEIRKREFAMLTFATRRWAIPCCFDNGVIQLGPEYLPFSDGKIHVDYSDCTSTEQPSEVDAFAPSESEADPEGTDES